MIYLNKIYTRSGDLGETGLGDGQRVKKDHPRVAAYGEVDELNATIGLEQRQAEAPHQEILREIQNDLFDIGADLCVPGVAGERLRVKPGQAEKLERYIDGFNERLRPLTSFILPGGAPLAASYHFARTVCRRAERSLVSLMAVEEVNPSVLVYLNRLSDLLFVMARVANDDGRADVLWQPGKNA